MPTQLQRLVHRLPWLLPLAAILATSFDARAGARLKDVALIAGARDNQLVGYGLVTGLAGDGDKDPVYSVQSIANMLQRFGVTVPPATVSTKNLAVVMITAEIPPFLKNGARLDVMVSSFGDAKSLQGGVLLQTPLYGADGKIYAVAQGALAVGGFVGGAGGGGGATVQKNHPTVAKIAGGALVEREIPSTIVRNSSIELLLREPDFTSAARLAMAINEVFTNSATALDPTSIRVKMPEGLPEEAAVDFIARLESIEFIPDIPARVIINERTGTIVATSRIRIAACAVSHGELTISVANSQDVSQPNAMSKGGTTAVTSRTDTQVNEAKARLITLNEMPTIEQVAAGLNSIGVTPRDMMSIFQSLKEAGALQAELIMR
jgi:flagellar P-ring protein precursor FlgI